MSVTYLNKVALKVKYQGFIFILKQPKIKTEETLTRALKKNGANHTEILKWTGAPLTL